MAFIGQQGSSWETPRCVFWKVMVWRNAQKHPYLTILLKDHPSHMRYKFWARLPNLILLSFPLVSYLTSSTGGKFSHPDISSFWNLLELSDENLKVFTTHFHFWKKKYFIDVCLLAFIPSILSIWQLTFRYSKYNLFRQYNIENSCFSQPFFWEYIFCGVTLRWIRSP